MRKTAILGTAFIVFAIASVESESAQLSSSPLRTIKCTFTDGAYTKIDTRGKRATTKIVKDAIDLTFDQIDDVAHKARLIGQNGADDVSVELLGNVLHMFDYTLVGGVIVFTVVDLDKISRTVPVRAVQSRHILSIDFDFKTQQPEILASQYYGTCIRFD